MAASQVITLILPFLTGGVMGTFIATAIATYKNRRQPVDYRVEVVSLAPQLDGWHFSPRISTMNQNSMRVDVERLDLVKVEIVSGANKDLASLTFGVTFPNSVMVLDVKTSSQDRYHKIKQITAVRTAVDETSPKFILGKFGGVPTDYVPAYDFHAQPFNRDETYTVEFAVVPNLASTERIEDAPALAAKDVVVGSSEVGLRMRRREKEISVAKYEAMASLLQRTWWIVIATMMLTVLYAVATKFTSHLILVSAIMIGALIVLTILVVVIPVSKRMNS